MALMDVRMRSPRRRRCDLDLELELAAMGRIEDASARVRAAVQLYTPQRCRNAPLMHHRDVMPEFYGLDWIRTLEKHARAM
jgi:hypothetical protein